MITALTIAGSDSIGGAGIQADIKAMSSLGVHATSVITAVTAQNTCTVSEIFPVPLEVIEKQINAVLEDCDIRAVKTGMLYNSEITKLVSEKLENVGIPLIIDPVLTASVGGSLAGDGVALAVKKYLMPLCDLITPNRFEGEVLAGMKINDEGDAFKACEIIGKDGAPVYLKGGHMDTSDVVDYYYKDGKFVTIEYPRLKLSGHGSGCTLSSFITANCALGLDMISSINKSRAMIQKSIETQYVIGKGNEVVNPIVRID